MAFADWLALQIAALLTLGIVSFLYKDNPFYKICESIFLGVSAGYWFVVLFWENMVPKLYDNIKLLFTDGIGAVTASDVSVWFYVIALILGIMMLMRLVPKLGWMARWPLSVVVGATAGLWFITYLQSNALIQLRSTLLPIVDFAAISAGGGSGLSNWFGKYLGNITIITGTVTGLFYFYFSKEHRGAFGAAARVGVYFLMVTFGASFGYTVMSRMSLLIGRIDFLLSEWWPALLAGWM